MLNQENPMASIELNNTEALVLIECLLRLRDKGKLSIEHDAEEQILYDLCAILENEVPELLDSNYKDLLNEARKELLKGEYC